MAFVHASAELTQSAATAEARGGGAVRLWLAAIALLVGAMVVVGGATRLTGSGLSITEWQPILGAIPPMSEESWREAFAKYQTLPQYEQVNNSMTLAEFKGIYWWEWAHRQLGRFIGLAFLIPFLVFAGTGRIRAKETPRIGALFILGAGQGLLGWVMVKSGLSERVDVSQYRLAAHLALAALIAGYAFWLSLSFRRPARPLRLAAFGPLAAVAITVLVYLQIVMGGFVAGLKAGHASDTWPLMNGAFVPEGAFGSSPTILNVFENPFAAQFAHRLIAYVLVLAIAAEAVRLFASRAAPAVRLSVAAMAACAACQLALGIATIVYHVPMTLALVHQATAIVLLALALWHLRRSVSVPVAL